VVPVADVGEWQRHPVAIGPLVASACIVPERYGAGLQARPVIARQMSDGPRYLQGTVVSTVCELSIAPSNVVV